MTTTGLGRVWRKNKKTTIDSYHNRSWSLPKGKRPFYPPFLILHPSIFPLLPPTLYTLPLLLPTSSLFIFFPSPTPLLPNPPPSPPICAQPFSLYFPNCFEVLFFTFANPPSIKSWFRHSRSYNEIKTPFIFFYGKNR